MSLHASNFKCSSDNIPIYLYCWTKSIVTVFTLWVSFVPLILSLRTNTTFVLFTLMYISHLIQHLCGQFKSCWSLSGDSDLISSAFNSIPTWSIPIFMTQSLLLMLLAKLICVALLTLCYVIVITTSTRVFIQPLLPLPISNKCFCNIFLIFSIKDIHVYVTISVILCHT